MSLSRNHLSQNAQLAFGTLTACFDNCVFCRSCHWLDISPKLPIRGTGKTKLLVYSPWQPVCCLLFLLVIFTYWNTLFGLCHSVDRPFYQTSPRAALIVTRWNHWCVNCNTLGVSAILLINFPVLAFQEWQATQPIEVPPWRRFGSTPWW